MKKQICALLVTLLLLLMTLLSQKNGFFQRGKLFNPSFFGIIQQQFVDKKHTNV